MSFLGRRLKRSILLLATVALLVPSALPAAVAPSLSAVPESLRPLVRQLGDSDRRVRQQAQLRLARFGERAVPGLVDLLENDRSAHTRRDAVTALRILGPKAAKAIPVLIASLKDPDAQVRLVAAVVLPRLGGEMLPALVEALPDTEGDSRLMAMAILARLGNPAVAALTERVQRGSPAGRLAAAQVLTYLGPKARGAAPALRKALATAGPELRREVELALQRIEPGRKRKSRP